MWEDKGKHQQQSGKTIFFLLPFSDATCSLLHAQHFVDGIDDVGSLGKAGGFQGLSVGHWSVNTAHSPHWCVQVEECFVLHDACADLRADA